MYKEYYPRNDNAYFAFLHMFNIFSTPIRSTLFNYVSILICIRLCLNNFVMVALECIYPGMEEMRIF